MAIYRSILGKNVELTKERKSHIIERHPDVEVYFSLIDEILLKPDEIRIDKYDSKVLLFYKYFSRIRKYLVVVVKLDKRSFMLTFYSTYRIRTGKIYEIKN